LFFVCALVAASLIFSAGVRGQNQTPAPNETADEDFELNIADSSRTTETNYRRSTGVEISGSSVTVGVGATVSAQKIDLFLRGVTGRVRFRASLEAIRRRIEQAGQNRPQNSGNR
jgi:hypothetical protein